MVLMSLFTGHRDTDVENGLVDAVGEEGVGRTERVTDIYTLSCVKQTVVGSCCVTQGAQLGAQ